MIRFNSFGRFYRNFYEGTEASPVTAPAPAQQQQAKTFTQAEVNEMMATNKRKLQEDNKTLVGELQTLRENTQLSEQQKAELTERITQLEATYTTEAQLRERENKVQSEKHAKDLKASNDRADAWQNRFNSALVNTDIAGAAIEFEACSAEQLQAILSPITKVVEALDEERKPNGQFTTQVDFATQDKDNKPIVLKLSVRDAVKEMTKIPKRFGNLFKVGGVGGLEAQTNGSQSVSELDIANMTPTQYAKHRETIHREMAKARA